MSWKRPLLRYVFKHYFSWRLGDLTDGQLISLGYRFDPLPRYGHGKPAHPQLDAIIAKYRPNFSSWIAEINGQASRLFEIDRDPQPEASEPSFRNGFFLGLDAAALYAIVAAEKPRRFVEVGSGNSTKFAKRSIRDNGLSTRIISIDPQPRADVEDSHCSFTNTDVTVFFLEILPRLQPGVILHIHDILLPFDYPPEWSERYYSEQYLLACWLLAGHQRFELMLSNAFVSMDPALSTQLSPLWDDSRFKGAKDHAAKIMREFKGYSFWARIAA
jgi:hypothetical protein